MNYRYFQYEIPYIKPIRIGTEVQSVRSGVLIQATSSEGRMGWGEAAPLNGYGPDTLEDVLAAIQTGGELPPSLRFGMDCANRAATSLLPLREWFGNPVVDTLRNAFLVSGNESPTEIVFPEVVKTKVGTDTPENDFNRVRSILERLHSRGCLRLDANGLWSKVEAFKFSSMVASRIPEATMQNGPNARIEFVEEPWENCFQDPDIEDYPLPVAIDESFEGMSDPWQKADVVVIKPALFGSLSECLTASDEILAAGKKVVLSSAFETAVALHVLVALAFRFDSVPGFGTYRYLSRDVGDKQEWLGGEVLSIGNLPDSPGAHLSPEVLASLAEIRRAT